MPYKTSFMDMAYPDETGRPCALQFRIALTATTERLAIVHLLETKAEYQGPMESSIVRDQILNRILAKGRRCFRSISTLGTTSSVAICTRRHISPLRELAKAIAESGGAAYTPTPRMIAMAAMTHRV